MTTTHVNPDYATATNGASVSVSVSASAPKRGRKPATAVAIAPTPKPQTAAERLQTAIAERLGEIRAAKQTLDAEAASLLALANAPRGPATTVLAAAAPTPKPTAARKPRQKPAQAPRAAKVPHVAPDVLDRVVTFLATTQGATSEEIQSACHLDKADVVKIKKAGEAAGVLRCVGKARGMRYFAVAVAADTAPADEAVEEAHTGDAAE